MSANKLTIRNLLPYIIILCFLFQANTGGNRINTSLQSTQSELSVIEIISNAREGDEIEPRKLEFSSFHQDTSYETKIFTPSEIERPNQGAQKLNSFDPSFDASLAQYEVNASASRIDFSTDTHPEQLMVNTGLTRVFDLDTADFNNDSIPDIVSKEEVGLEFIDGLTGQTLYTTTGIGSTNK
ncbi:MAG: hypothetical protein ACXAD7_26400, partial [Candidatus Kariarchaeaceae archaeon]